MVVNAMDDRKGLDADELLDALKALSNPVRWQIMEWLRDPDGEFAEYEPIANRSDVGVCVSHIQAKTGLAQSTVSSYMSVLERAGLVRATRVGKWTHYKRDENKVIEISEAIKGNL